MRRACLSVFLSFTVSAAAAQGLPPHLLRAYAVGQAASLASQASPCFPNDRAAAEALARMFAEARARIRGQPDMEATYAEGEMRTSQQQRHIPRSDPVACRQAFEALRHFLAN